MLFLYVLLSIAIGLFAVFVVIHLSDGSVKLPKQKVENKTQTSIIDKHYTREDRLIEAHELVKNHGVWTFKTATKAIDNRMDLVRKTMGTTSDGHNRKFRYTCPVCRKENYGLEFVGPQIHCSCPGASKIKQIYKETKWECPY